MKLTYDEIESKSKSSFVVLLVEEFGYRSWFWFPSMNPSDLEKWWSSLKTVAPYFMTPDPLPGTLCQVLSKQEVELFSKLDKTNKYYSGHIHCDDDSCLIRPDDSKVYHQGYEG